jgi:phospholipid transport system substrate-binding protein
VASLLAALALVSAPAGVRAADGGSGGAVAVIDQLHATMLDVMKRSSQLDYQQRFDLLAPAIARAYDLDFMARKSLGRGFDGLDPADQKRWLALFRTYMVANYAGRFHGGDKGQRFETLREEPSAQSTVLVLTKLIEPGGEVALNYRMRETGGQWKVVDVYLKGTVSELALRRSDFTATMDREGFPALIANLEGKIADLAAGKVK